MATTPTYYAGTDLSLDITIQDPTGAAVDLASSTVTLKMIAANGYQYTLSPAVTNAAAGQCSQALTSTQLANAGEYQFQVLVTTGGAVTATNTFSLTLDSQLF